MYNKNFLISKIRYNDVFCLHLLTEMKILGTQLCKMSTQNLFAGKKSYSFPIAFR